MSSIKSAKDLAFEKERIRFRQEIREKEFENKTLKLEIASLKDVLRCKENELYEKQEWIDRLLDFLDMPEEDFRSMLDKERSLADSKEKFSVLFGSMFDYVCSLK